MDAHDTTTEKGLCIRLATHEVVNINLATLKVESKHR